jgi:signal transduction histidine kinase/CheY-like chemotaxis protein
MQFLSGSSEQNEPPLILIADDEPAFRCLLRKMLEMEGYRTREARNGEECLAAYQQAQPDLVLLDAIMPVMDGFACCRELSQRVDCFEMPILIVTNLDDLTSIDLAFAAGATDYITKPVQWAVLRHRVRRLLQQARRYRQAKQFGANLDSQVQACAIEIRDRTIQLGRALEFEATLKRITDKVRDSLDEDQILQTAVQELAWALDVGCCNAALYDSVEGTSIVRYEYATSISGYQNWTIAMASCPEIYQQLVSGQHFQFCSLPPNPIRGRVAMFACPLINEQETIGDLWLINPADRSLNELEIRLVGQVANQCAIALRQARLYQAAQAQVRELEKLNQLKDDFLSTVSHELRTPLANIRLAIQMLEHTLLKGRESGSRGDHSNGNHVKAMAYLRILHDECEREISLVNDLLDLQRFEAGRYVLGLTAIELATWLPPVVEPFQTRSASRQQILTLQIDVDLPMLMTDPQCLKRIVAELLHNACKYTPPGGTIVLEAACSAQQLHLRISNSGVEIPIQELSRIFDKFYRVPSGDPWKQGGTGLGLALVKRLVEHLQGTIAVESSNGRTCFTVQLPLPLQLETEHLQQENLS